MDMDVLLAMAFFVGAMIICIANGLWMPIGLAAGLCGFACVALRRGVGWKSLGRIALSSINGALPMARLFLLIGMITGLWRASGTIASFIYWGMKLIVPETFLIMAFLLNCALSYALGTSFGVSGTLGVIFMALARSGGVNELMTAGVVISGVYFGDRCSPASSCANVVAAATGTEIMPNVRMMLKIGILPFCLTLAIYAVLSPLNPIAGENAALLSVLTGNFRICAWALLPAALIVVLPLIGVKVWQAMLCCAAASAAVAALVQGAPAGEIFRIMISGFHPSNAQLANVMSGGGVGSMMECFVIVLISSVYSGIFNATGMLSGVRAGARALADKTGSFPAMALSGTAIIAVFCNQVISVLMAVNLWDDAYGKDGRGRAEFAQDIYNSIVTIAGLVPWCLACYGPLEILGAGFGALPYAALLYLTPLCYLFTKRWFFPSDKIGKIKEPA